MRTLLLYLVIPSMVTLVSMGVSALFGRSVAIFAFAAGSLSIAADLWHRLTYGEFARIPLWVSGVFLLIIAIAASLSGLWAQ